MWKIPCFPCVCGIEMCKNSHCMLDKWSCNDANGVQMITNCLSMNVLMEHNRNIAKYQLS